MSVSAHIKSKDIVRGKERMCGKLLQALAILMSPMDYDKGLLSWFVIPLIEEDLSPFMTFEKTCVHGIMILMRQK